jgi:hypothetical protein
MIATITLAVGIVAVITAVAAVVTRVLVNRRERDNSNRSMRDLGPVSQQWLNGHRSEWRL